jgi:predicted transcriptional regulator
MGDYRLTRGEQRLAELIWAHEPLPSGELVKRAFEELNWKKSTTYTMLRILCNKGIFKNENAMVSSILSKDELRARQSQRFVEDTFEGSLPQFLVAFASGGKLNRQQTEKLKRFIDEYGEGR